MKKNILLVFLFFSGISFSLSQSKTTFLLKQKSDKFEVINQSQSGFTANGNISKLFFDNKKTNKGSFAELKASGLVKTFGSGNPDLPVYSRLIEVPQEAKVKISVVSYDEEIIDLTKRGITEKIMPAQPPLRKDVDRKDVPFCYNEKVYNTDKFFSQGSIAIYENAGQMRDVRLGRIEVRPFEYNPVKNQLKVLNNIIIKVEFEGADYAKSYKLKRKYASPYFSVSGNSVIYKLKDASKELIQSAPVTYVIVSPPEFRDSLQPFIQWKTMKGFNVIEAYTDNPDVGTTVSSIKAYLQNLYESPSPGINPPSFILIVGDIDKIPATQHSEVSNSPYSDLDYAEYTGDYLPEVNFGRWSADNAIQVSDIAAKTIRYEKLEMSDPSYLHETFLIAGNDETYEDTYGGGAIYYADNYYTNAAHNIYSHTFLQSTIETWPDGNTQAHDSIIQNINDGVALANYTAHCSSDGWSDPSFSQNDLNNYITNDDKYGVWIGNCCQSNMFNVDESFGEIAIRKPNAGVIGYIGGSQYTYWDEDYWWGVGVADISATPSYEGSTAGSYDGLFHDGANEINDISTWFTTNYQFIKAGNLAVQSSTSPLKDYYWVIYQLAGDPSITSFVGTPQPMTVTPSPSSIILGSTSLSVLSAPYSYVALSQNGVLIAAAVSDASGNASLSFNANALSVGNADLVVTAQNKVPYIGTITVSPADQPYVVLNAYTTSASPDYGQSITLNVTLENVAASGSGYDAINTNATLYLTDSYITITDATEYYGTITAGTTKTIDNAFAVTIADSVPDQYDFNFDITITGEDGSSNNYTWPANLTMTANAPVITIGDVFITNDDNNDGIFNAGETGDINFTVTNTGHASADFSGILSVSSDPDNYISLGNTSVSPVLINSSGSEVFSFAGASVDINALQNSPAELQLDAFAGENLQYSETSNQVIFLDFIPEYCAASGGCDEYIANVKIGDINNSSACDNYFDYTDLSTDVVIGETYPLEITVGTPYSEDRLAAYVDWNYDGDFDDENEVFPMTWASPTATANITVPVDAKKKPVRMRVRLVYNENPVPCGTTLYGEAEDYTLNVSAGITSINKTGDETIQIVPNPNSGRFTLRTGDLIKNAYIEIYSVSGKLIYNSIISSNIVDINLSNQARGIYFIKITSDNQIVNSKLIIK